LHGESIRPASLGLRLQAIGDGVKTGKSSWATLQLDTGIGEIDVREHTVLKIVVLKMAAQGGRVTRLRLEAGNIRLRLRRFSNPSSVFELETPTGVSAVRGTDFSVVVQPNGQSGVVVQEGLVALSAQQTSVLLGPNTQGLVAVGQAPQVLQYDPLPPFLSLLYWTRLGRRWVRITGKTAPMNRVTVNDVPRSIGESGRFDLILPLQAESQPPYSPTPEHQTPLLQTSRVLPRASIQVQVTTPFGERRHYAISAP
jgi:hypothetical protein